MVILISVYVPPLASPHKGRLAEAGLLPTEAAAFLELSTVLELPDLPHEPVLLMGDFNACIAVLAPTVEGQLPCMSTDTLLNACGRALLSLFTQQKLQLLSGTTQLSCHATSIGGYGPDSATSVVDYAITSCTAPL